ncbi:right-handed parallel beta-helix repeat-containing protein [Salinicola halimionae]|uniref:right-handed parallel beta-helix repeat-containing protein n=1 Tax=Salinicola halimionae TaxID=1949081 RepID=UPI000DA1216A|nr:right-handed parallel beta-helix repeat-containing protein [Salinicola halimionae]
MEVKTFFTQDTDGQTISNARVTVRHQGNAEPAPDLQDVSGAPLSNPFTSNSEGLIQLAAPNGHYAIDVEKGDSRQSLTAQFFDQDAVASASGTQTLAAALNQRLIVVDSVDMLKSWPADHVTDGVRLICKRFHHDLPDEINVELQRRTHLDDTSRAGQMAWLAIDGNRPDFHHFTLWSDDGAAYVHESHDVHLLKVGFRADYNAKATSGSRGTDESAWLQETIDKTPFRNKYLPDLPDERGLYVGEGQIRLCSGTRIIGDGPATNSRIVSDYVGASFRDGLFWMREPHVIDAWAKGRPAGDIDQAFSHDIRISGLTFEATDFASAAVALVCVRGVDYHENHHIRCGGIKFFHELELNDRYSLGHEDDPATDNAVMAGFHAQTPDDLNQQIRISHLSGGTDRYSYSPGDGKAACAVRLNFVRDFSIAHIHMDYCNISGWGGSARPGKGGELRWMRRLRDGYITDVHCNRSNGAIYFNNAHNIKIYGCSAKDVSDTAFDFEGCTYCLFDGIYSVNAGNFGISIFYATRGNVIKNFYALQTSEAAELRSRYATERFKPGLGKTLFRRLAGFEDPDFEQDVVLDTGSFVYEGEGFGLVAVDSWVNVTYRNVQHHNVLMDLRAHSNAREQQLHDNRFTFTKKATDGDVFVAIGPNSTQYGCWKGGTIESTVEQPSGVIPLLVQARAYAGTTIVDIMESRIDVPGVETSIAISDARSTGRRPAHAFRLNGNLITAGSRIENLNLNQRAGGDALQFESLNNRDLTFKPVDVETTKGDSAERYAALRIGLKATRPREQD